MRDYDTDPPQRGHRCHCGPQRTQRPAEVIGVQFEGKAPQPCGGAQDAAPMLKQHLLQEGPGENHFQEVGQERDEGSRPDGLGDDDVAAGGRVEVELVSCLPR